MNAKRKFIDHLFSIIAKKPKMVLFMVDGIPKYTFKHLDNGRTNNMYELLNINFKTYLYLNGEKNDLVRMRNKINEMIPANINEIEILYKDGETQIMNNESSSK
jgi:hypothetical protein